MAAIEPSGLDSADELMAVLDRKRNAEKKGYLRTGSRWYPCQR